MKIKKTVIMLDYSCNNKCIFCYNDHKRDYKKKDAKEIFKEIYNAKKRGTTYLELIGGEPTARDDFIQILKYANKQKFDTLMFATNGRLLSYKPYAKKIIESGVTHIVFSIHGHDAKLHDSLVQVNGAFNQLTQGIKNVKELGLKDIGTNTTIVKQNYKKLLEIGKLIDSLEVKNSEFIFCDPTRGGAFESFDEIVPTYEEVSYFVNKLIDFGKIKKKKHWDIRYYLLCFLDKKNHSMVSELKEVKNFHTEHIGLDFINKNAESGRRENGRTTDIEFCKTCKLNNICEGPWIEYIKKRKINFNKVNEDYIKNGYNNNTANI